MTSIIGITGHAGAGKDTAGEQIINAIRDSGMKVVQDSFAAPIRDAAEGIGLNPFDRIDKERTVSLGFEDFDGVLFDSFDYAMRGVKQDDRATLYAIFIGVLERDGYLSGDHSILTISPRKFCQLLGTEGGRAVSDTLWIDALKARAAKTPARILITDVRFRNEATACDVVVGVRRQGLVVDLSHPSEASVPALVDASTYVLDNNRSLGYFQDCAYGVGLEIVGMVN